MGQQALSSQSEFPDQLETPSRILPYVHTDADGLHHLYLNIEGIHCAGCIKKIEDIFLSESHVSHARVNFTTKRLHISWNGESGYADKIIPLLQQAGYNAFPYDFNISNTQSKKEGQFLLTCLGVAGFAAGNIMLLSFPLWTTDLETMGVGTRDFIHWISALIALPAVGFAGQPFFRSAFDALKNKRTNMDVPISVGLIITLMISLLELYNHGEHAYFDSAVMLVFFLLTGRYLDFRARNSARNAASDLIGMMSGTATLLGTDNQKSSVLIKSLKSDDMIIIAAGEYFPADCLIVQGVSEIDTHYVTGETLTRPIQEGDTALSGVINLSAPLIGRVLRNAEESQIGAMIKIMEEAENTKSGYVRIADKVARLYTPVVHLLALLAFLFWNFVMGHEWKDSLLTAITVLIITCPCALSLAIPVVQVLAIGQLMRRGVLVKAGDLFERLNRIDTIIFDKTGTLTYGTPALINIQDIKPDHMKLAASLAQFSLHPLSKAVSASYQGNLFDMNVSEIAGYGLETVWQGQRIRLGRPSWALRNYIDTSSADTKLALSLEGEEQAIFHFKDKIRTDAANVLDALKSQSYKLILLSGDREPVVSDMAQALGLSEYKSDMTPQGKFDFLKKLQAEGHHILMVGDGINDAPILAAADASIAPSSAIDIARHAADAVYTGDKLFPVIDIIRTSRRAGTLMRQNLAAALLYNIIAIPIAFAGYVTPLLAAAAMSLSSLIVTMNAFRLRMRS